MGDSLWFKDAIIYEVAVRAFADSDGDGIGDFPGLTGKLDYFQELGVSALWLLPFFPSPLRDDGYDTSDFTNVNPIYGSLEDFQAFLQAAHQRNLKVIIELILNHTSDQHPWFQRARRAAPGSPERQFYVWSDTPHRYSEARIIFQDFETSNWTWDPIAHAYYWHRFYSHQPDLNYDHPAVIEAMFQVMDFWLDLGVDGLRLDAVPYLFEREGSDCENLPETHHLLKQLRQHIDQRYQDRMLLAEANQWPEDAVAYFGKGDECHMDFHFPLMPRLFMAVQMEDRFPIIDILKQTPAIPDNCQWAIFLRNHDELTLEMVTDEDRDYMWRMYAGDPQARINLGIRRRLAPLLGNDRRRIELMNALLFSLPGTPVIYYGDELGMGDNIYLGDRNGVRTPMQWSPDRNAGFSRANPQRLFLPIVIEAEYHYESVNVEAQHSNPNSLWWAMKRLMAVRKKFLAFGRGSFEVLHPANRQVLAFMRVYHSASRAETILVVANLSHHVQWVELDLSAYEGWIPVEIFGRKEFPPIGSLPYLLSLAPHAFYWFELRSQSLGVGCPANLHRSLPSLQVNHTWSEITRGAARQTLEAILPDYLCGCAWFAGKNRRIETVAVQDGIPLGRADQQIQITLICVEFAVGPAQTYVLPLAWATGDHAQILQRDHAEAVIAHLSFILTDTPHGILYDALADPACLSLLLASLDQPLPNQGSHGRWVATPTTSLPVWLAEHGEVQSAPRKPKPSHTTIVYSPLPNSPNEGGSPDPIILKLFRQVEGGINPELEAARHLAMAPEGFPHVPALLGYFEYKPFRPKPGSNPEEMPFTLGLLQTFIPNEGEAWSYTLDHLQNFFENILVYHPHHDPILMQQGSLLGGSHPPAHFLGQESTAAYLESTRLLGLRTAQLHEALAGGGDAGFAPEAFSSHYQRSLYQSMRNLWGQVHPQLQSQQSQMSSCQQALARQVLQQDELIYQRFRRLFDHKIQAMRIRCHGDFHLKQVLFTGKDFVIINFAGDPTRPLSERKLKRVPLRDVGGMLYSYHCAVQKALNLQQERGLIDATNRELMQEWGRVWQEWVGATFLQSYLAYPGLAPLLPPDHLSLQILLDAYRLEKAIADLGYRLEHEWGEEDIGIPLQGIIDVLSQGQSI
ncbi:MAG: maltose alpha-D-glucosyltransferase [Cyanobacteriota bacterium]|nr:maltose alpha-D-glucosyltransferase [Cyanobacteriota bacterium]